MTNMKAGIIGVVSTIIIVTIELFMFPVALNFLPNLNSTATCNSTGGNCVNEWISSSDRTTLASVPTLMVVVVLLSVLGGMIGSVYLAVKG